MKNLLIITVFLGSLTTFSQTLSLDTGETYAVVVGISDYQDEQIPDLRFADKDAEAFASFLRSPAGGSLDNDHLKVLINEQATQAQFGAALDWLWEVAAENDRVIIYFSGHGDVERKSITQPGYLLCWDAPSSVYMAGGAFNIRDLNDVVSTISIQNKAKVILVTDACRAGKLSGSVIGGAQATAANLAKQYANEIKILSCQPDEYSVEGEQWGGGRGAFSYHLLDGLYGMADGNSDLNVSLKEIGRYLEDNVTEQVAPEIQNPMIIGDKTEKLIDVFPEILDQLKEGKRGHMQLFTATDSRGIEEEILVAADSNIVEMYYAFQKALADEQFLFVTKEQAEKGRTQNDYADYYYEILSQEPTMERLHSSMRRNYSAALQDAAQQVMNNWMKSSKEKSMETNIDKKQKRLPKKVFTEKVRAFPACLERASELLGKEHYMYPILKARKHFFEGYLLANSDQNPNKALGEKALSQFHQALEWQPDLPQAYWQMIYVYGYNLLEPDSAAIYAQKAMDLYPYWVLPYVNLVFIYSEKYKQYDQAKPYIEKALAIDSSSALVWNIWGLYSFHQKQYDQAEKKLKKAIQLDSTISVIYSNLGLFYQYIRRYEESEKQYKKAIQLDSTFALPHINLAFLYQTTRRNYESEVHYKKAIQLDSTITASYNNLGNVYRSTRRFKEAEKQIKKAIQIDSTYAFAYNSLGILYKTTRRYDEAEKQFKKAIQLDSTYSTTYDNLGSLYQLIQRYDEAEQQFKKAIQLDSTNVTASVNLGYFYQSTGRYDEAEKQYERAIQFDSTNANVFLDLGILYFSTGRIDETEQQFKKAIQLDSTNVAANGNLGIFYKNVRRYEEAEKQIKKTIQLDSTYIYGYFDLGNIYRYTRRYDESEKYYKKAIQLDSTNASFNNNLGKLYIKLKRFEEAEKYYKKAIQLDSSYYPPYYNLGHVYRNSKRYVEAEKYLKEAIQLDSTYPLQYHELGIVYKNTRRYGEAEKHLKKALQLDSTYISAYNNLGLVYKNTRSYVAAEKHYKKALQLDSTFWAAYANLGLQYQLLERWEASEGMILKSIKYSPPLGLLHAVLGNAYTHLPGKMEDAKKELDKALEMNINHPDTYIYLAQWSLKNNQLEETWQYLEQGLEKGLENGELELDYLKTQADFEEMRKDPKWGELMQKYFPEQDKK
jgi:tetratricopeptide (TPR) repeat protein